MKLLFITLSLLLMINCKTKKTASVKKEKSPKTSCKISAFPMDVFEATYQNWYGGMEGVHGIKIEFKGNNLKETVVFKSIYFKNKSAKCYTKTVSNITIVNANIDTSNRKEHYLHQDSTKEYGNKAPVKKEIKYPNLKENEALIHYTINATKKTTRIALSKKEDLFYP